MSYLVRGRSGVAGGAALASPYCGVLPWGVELGPELVSVPPMGVEVLLAGWPTVPVLPPPIVFISDSGS